MRRYRYILPTDDIATVIMTRWTAMLMPGERVKGGWPQWPLTASLGYTSRPTVRVPYPAVRCRSAASVLVIPDDFSDVSCQLCFIRAPDCLPVLRKAVAGGW